MTLNLTTGGAARRSAGTARAAVSAVFFAAGGGLGVWAAHIPLLKAGLAVDDAQLGVVLLGMALGCIAGMPLAGPFLRRFGAPRAMTGAAVAFALAVALAPHAPAYPLLVAAAVAIGAAFGVLDIAMNAHAAVIEKAFGRPVMSSIHAFFSIGGLAGAAAGGGLIALGFAAPSGMGLSMAALAALVLLAAPRLALPRAETAEEPGGHALRLPGRAVLGLGALALLAFVAEGAMIDWSAVFMVQATAATPALAACAYAAFSAAMTFGRFNGDRVVARLGPARAVQLSCALAAAGLALVVAAPNPAAALAGFVITGLGFANVVPVLFSACSRVPGVPPATALAMVVTMAYGGGLMGPPLIGFLGHAVGLRVAFLVLIAASLVVGLGVGHTIRRR